MKNQMRLPCAFVCIRMNPDKPTCSHLYQKRMISHVSCCTQQTTQNENQLNCISMTYSKSSQIPHMIKLNATNKPVTEKEPINIYRYIYVYIYWSTYIYAYIYIVCLLSQSVSYLSFPGNIQYFTFAAPESAMGLA